MKKIILFFVVLFVAVGAIFAVFRLSGTENQNKSDEAFKVVTSFYPMYIATLNITKDIENVEVKNLTEPQTGCLHDYQLTPEDMIALEGADVFIINGGGMESFIEDVIKQYPNMPIINASEGIDYLENTDNDHNHEQENHNHEEEENAHVWVSVTKYIEQINNITEGLQQADQNNKEEYYKNGNDYIAKLNELNQQMHSELDDIKNEDIIIFHDSFAYFADEFELDVKHTVVMESDASLSAGEIAEIIDEIKSEDVKVLFTEEQYSDKIAQAVSKETEAKVYILDSCVSGKYDIDSYIIAMKNNLAILKEALK